MARSDSDVEIEIRKEAHTADRDLYSGLIRMHVLHHAVEGPVFGLAMMEELGRHGYRISAGSLYPLLQSLQKMLSAVERAERQQIAAQGIQSDSSLPKGVRCRQKQGSEAFS